MDFNPSKCFKMSVHRKKALIYVKYILYNKYLLEVKHHPHLGILLSSDLRWNSHVDWMFKKASSVLGFVKRNLNLCSEATKRAAFIALVRPLLEYGSAVWDPYRQEQMDTIEAFQRRQFDL